VVDARDEPAKPISKEEAGIGVQIFVSAKKLKNMDLFTLSDP
jgi:hypothetical protein